MLSFKVWVVLSVTCLNLYTLLGILETKTFKYEEKNYDLALKQIQNQFKAICVFSTTASSVGLLYKYETNIK